MQISLINEHLFCKYFIRLSVGNATKGFATYGCCHPCFINVFVDRNHGDICLEPEHLELLFSYLQRVSYDAAR